MAVAAIPSRHGKTKLKRKISSRTLKSAFKYVTPKKASKYRFLKQLLAVIVSAVIFFFASNSLKPTTNYQRDSIKYEPITTPPEEKKSKFKNTFDARLNSWKPIQTPVNQTPMIKKLDISTFKEPSLAEIDYTRPPDSLRFIFHNKLPKSGSSTMNGLLRQLARRNGFNYQKLEPVDVNGDRFDLEKPLMNYLQQHFRPPYFLLKHHFFFNMARYNLTGVIEPTYVNVIRDPLDWFVSHYYFERFGWARKKTDRNFKGSEEDLKRTVDECVMQRHFECLHPTHKYLEFICGTSTLCQTSRLSTTGLIRAVLMAKHNIATKFFMVGILEQFDETVLLFEKMLPSYYDGAWNLYNTPEVQMHRNQTKTINRKEVSNATSL